MGTILKYLFYALIILAIYFLGVGFYQGTIHKESTLSDVANHISSNTKETLKEGYETTKDAVQGGIEELKDEGQEAEKEVQGGLKE
ncbi:MAG TPA: hypothetical protein DIC64_04670 [Alphaproteobacteria bacterium]|nr:hypothetical protein [Alphaproteobacteria bacterium]